MHEGRSVDIGLRATERVEGSATVIELFGELDLETAPWLRARLRDALGSGLPDLVVDAAGLRFCDSTGISVLVDIWKQTERGGGRFAVRAPSTPVRRVLEIAGLSELLGVQGEPGANP